jgi:hypothetical protein
MAPERLDDDGSGFARPKLGLAFAARHAETLLVLLVLGVSLVIGFATAADYGLSTDEFNTDDYGPKTLAWYTSAFANRSQFEAVEEYLWMYGPWFQMLVAAVQSLELASPITVRHAMTFLFGLAGLAAVVPMARLTVGYWAGLTALTLSLLTGYLYGNLFFAPIDVPFLFAMSWSTLLIVLMVRQGVPSWRLTLTTGLATGLAIATRTGGVITHAYLVGGMSLCALEALLRHGRVRAVVGRYSPIDLPTVPVPQFQLKCWCDFICESATIGKSQIQCVKTPPSGIDVIKSRLKQGRHLAGKKGYIERVRR